MFNDDEIQTVSANPIYRQIAEILKSNIISGKLPCGVQLPPEPELARKFNASRITLRKSLKILEEQNLLIQRKGLGTFITYQSTAKLRIAISGIALNNNDPFSYKVFVGLNQALSNIQKEFVFIDSEGSLLDKFHHSRCDALVSVAPSSTQMEELSSDKFDSIPMVMLNAQKGLDGQKRVCIDVERDSMRTAVEHLSKLGHRRIAYITREGREINQRDRNSSFIDSIKDLGLDSDPDLYQCETTDMLWYDIGRSHALKSCRMSRPPTAIICPNSTISLGAWQGIIESGMKIPENISIIGYDVPEWANPHLTTLIQPEIEMSEAAGKLLLDQFNHGVSQSREMIFKIRLEERGSCSQADIR